MNKRARSVAGGTVELLDALVDAGLSVERARAVAQVPQRQIRIDPRRPYREPNSPADEAVFVRSGVLAKYRTEAAGRRQIVALRFAGEGVLPRDHAVDYGLQAIVPCELLAVRKEDFDQLLIDFPELAPLCLRETQRQAAIGQEWLMNCGSRDSTTRVAHLFCELAVRSGAVGSARSFPNPFTQMQIAEITGQTSVNVSRVLADLERSGLLQRQGRDLVIHDWAEFGRVARFSPAYLG
jgi:CRP-like cAMP-binding protein